MSTDVESRRVKGQESHKWDKEDLFNIKGDKED